MFCILLLFCRHINKYSRQKAKPMTLLVLTFPPPRSWVSDGKEARLRALESEQPMRVCDLRSSRHRFFSRCLWWRWGAGLASLCPPAGGRAPAAVKRMSLEVWERVVVVIEMKWGFCRLMPPSASWNHLWGLLLVLQVSLLLWGFICHHQPRFSNVGAFFVPSRFFFFHSFFIFLWLFLCWSESCLFSEIIQIACSYFSILLSLNSLGKTLWVYVVR